MQTRSNQSLFDLAVAHAGDATAAFDMALASGLSLTEWLPSGTPVQEVAVVNRRVAEFYASRGWPATGMPEQQAPSELTITPPVLYFDGEGEPIDGDGEPPLSVLTLDPPGPFTMDANGNFLN